MGTALREQGHKVRLIPAQFIKPYRKSNKNDFIDAEAIAGFPKRERPDTAARATDLQASESQPVFRLTTTNKNRRPAYLLTACFYQFNRLFCRCRRAFPLVNLWRLGGLCLLEPLDVLVLSFHVGLFRFGTVYRSRELAAKIASARTVVADVVVRVMEDRTVTRQCKNCEQKQHQESCHHVG